MQIIKKNLAERGLVSKLVIGACIFGFQGVPDSVLAQEVVKIEEIVVTAQRKSETLQEAPLSLTAVSGEGLKSLAITSVGDLEMVTPGLLGGEDALVSTPIIRGVGTGFTGAGLEASVPVYVDDIYIQNQFAQLQTMLDVSQVQVLKGPQGVLYGRNATGGAILLSTNAPSTEAFEGHIEAEGGTEDARRGEVVVNLPISSTLALRAAGSYEELGNYIDNVGNTPDSREGMGGLETLHARASLGWFPSDDTELIVAVDYNQLEAPIIRLQRSTGTDCLTCVLFGDTPATDFFTTTLSDQDVPKTEATIVSIRFRHDFGDIEFVSTTSYQEGDNTSHADVDLTQTRFFEFSNFDGQPFEAWTQDFRIATQLDGPFNFTAGFSYLASEEGSSIEARGLALAALPGVPLETETVDTESFAGYLEFDYDFTERLRLTVGGRYTADERSYVQDTNIWASLAFGDGLYLGDTGEVSFNSFTPRVVLSYDADWANFYASYNQGFKSGGYSVTNLGAPPVEVGPEEIDSYEVGVKGKFFEDRARFSLAYYHYEWDNMQVQVIDPGTGASLLVNAAASSSDGVEGDLQIAISKGLTVGGAFAWQDASFNEFDNAPIFLRGAVGFTQLSQDASGYQLPQAPEFSANVNARYEFQHESGWHASFSLFARYNSEYDFFPVAGGPLGFDRQDDYIVVNISGEVTPPGDSLSFFWSVANLTDEEYSNQTGTTNFGVYELAARPRVFRAGVRWSF